jgi:Abnormal spindle-like microcephaly-assoc'd, ASPM-SPD-2-Hydin
MSFWHLPADWPEIITFPLMGILRSNTQRLSVPVAVVVLAMLVTMLPSPLRAASDELKFSPSSLSYGDVAIGESQTLTIAVTNNGTKSLTISSVEASNSKFVVEKLKLPQAVAAGGHINVSVAFTPTATGLLDGHVTVVGSGVDEAFGVSGTGTGTSKSQLTITPSTLNFGDVAVGGTGTQTAELTASGGSVIVSSASSSSSLFALPGKDFPLTIASGKSVSVNVTFTPAKSGQDSGKLSFASNATNSATSELLSGAGTTPFVSLSWNASTSEVSGYNVYRRTTSNGSYVKMNSSLVSGTDYTDKTVSKGSYFYATTAVNSKGEESIYSNQIDVVVP